MRVLDFGLARTLDAPPMSLPSFIELTGSLTSGERLTQAGTILGTPGYMSPEQVRGAEADARSDQFSFCAALYEALYQQLPFAGETFDEFAREVLAGRLRPPPTHEHPLVLAQALVRGLSVDPGARFSSMQELIAALRAGLDPDSESLATRRASRRFGVLVALSSVIAASQMFRHGVRDADKNLSTALLVASIFLLGVLGGLVSFRSLLRRERYRRLAFFALIVAVFIMAGRTVGYVLGHTANRYMPIEMMAMAALLMLEAPKSSRSYAWLAAMMATGGIVIAVWPQLRSPITNLIYPLTAIAAVHYALRPDPGGAAERPPGTQRERG